MTGLHHALDGIATADRLAAQVADWSAVNSGSGNLAGIGRMIDGLADAIEGLGYRTARVAATPHWRLDREGSRQPVAAGPMLRGWVRPEAPRRVLLVGHCDTVFDAAHPFQACLRRADGTLHGPGTADMKGGLAVMLAALAALERSPLAAGLGIDIVINSDEETGSLGSAALIAERGRAADIGLIFEPAQADGTLAGARAGSANYQILLTGRAAHAGRDFAAGRNAITAAARLIAALDALNGQRPGVTLNIALIQGGRAPNIVPDRALLGLNLRARDPADLAWADGALRALVAGVPERETDIAAAVAGGIHRPCKPVDPATERLFQAVAAVGAELGLPPIRWTASGGCCDGNNLAAVGLPTVDTLGVRGGAIHTDAEFAVIDSLPERARLTALLLLRLAAGDIAWPMAPRGAVAA